MGEVASVTTIYSKPWTLKTCREGSRYMTWVHSHQLTTLSKTFPEWRMMQRLMQQNERISVLEA
jgi:hypothetical protein